MHFRSWFRDDSLESVDFGGLKSISLANGVYLLINNASGPGLPFLPIIYQQTGLFTCSIMIIILSFISCIISMAVVESIQKIPDNEDFSLRIEYLDLIKYYCEPLAINPRSPQRSSSQSSPIHPAVEAVHKTASPSLLQSQLLSVIAQVAFYLFLITLLITNIIQTCHTIDMLICNVFGTTFGLQFYPQFTGVRGNDESNPFNPFRPDSYVLSIGSLIVMACILPFCLKELEHVIWMQRVSIYGTAFIVVFMCILFPFSSEFLTVTSQMNVTNFDVDGIGNLLPINFFNLSFVCTVPSWINEKHLDVSYSKTLKLSSVAIAFIFISVGIINAMSFYYDYTVNENMLYGWIHFHSSSSSSSVNAVNIIASFIGYLYPLCQCLTSVPVYCIVLRYNLLNAECVRNLLVSNIIVIGLPFVLCIALYHYDAYLYIMCWSGLFLSSFVNFILPLYFYYIAITRPVEEWDTITASFHHQRQLSKSPTTTRYHRFSRQRSSVSSKQYASDPNITPLHAPTSFDEISTDNIGLLQHRTIEDYGAISPVTADMDEYYNKSQGDRSSVEEYTEDEEEKGDDDAEPLPLNAINRNIVVITPINRMDSDSFTTPPKQTMDSMYQFPYGTSNPYALRNGQYGASAGGGTEKQIMKTMYDSPILNRTKTLYLLICLLVLFIVSCVLAFCAVISA